VSENQAETKSAIKSTAASVGSPLRTRMMCHVLGVSTSGYYAWKDRAPSAGAQSNVALTDAITRAHAASDEIYGAHKIHAELRDPMVSTHDSRWARVGKNRVAKLMREACLRGVSNRRSYVVTTERNKRERPAPDLVNRKFVATAPNQLWVADITYVPTWAGFVFLAVVLDVWSRKIVGWHIGESLHTDLIVAALEMAAQARKPQSVIHHSDQGCQYTSVAFGKRCKELNVRPSMGTVGDAYDNAMAESFFSLLESELLQRRVFKTKADASMALFTYVEAWYNRVRRHGALGQLSPLAFEQKFAATTAVENESKADDYLDPNINDKSSTASNDTILTVMQSS
jgi:putative transposase